MEYHPARYALVELVNVHDDGIVFEPIHRVVFNINTDDIINHMQRYFGEEDYGFIKLFNSTKTFELDIASLKDHKGHMIPFVTKDTLGIIYIYNPKFNLEVATLQAFLDEFIEENQSAKIDYIHGDDTVKELGMKENNIGFMLPAMSKHDLFKTVVLDGVLPRKTFSMGKSEEKRFYLECRKIV
jgi:hypothetical protein